MRVPPGSYNLAVWNNRDVNRWALAPFTVTKENTTATLTFNESVTISGRIIAANGADPGSFGDVAILLRSDSGLPSRQFFTQPDSKGQFSFDRLPWKGQWLSVEAREGSTYVQEIRYNGLPLRSHKLEAIPGGKLEIVLDSQAATLRVVLKTGEAPTSGRVALVPTWLTEPPVPLANFPPFVFALGSIPGLMSSPHLPPGEYRVVPLSSSLNEDITDAAAVAAMLARAEKVTLARGEQKSIEPQLK
jgi:hypothetical protein